MLESHNLDEGPVYDDCACGPDAVGTTTTTKPESTTSPLPDWCFSPDGESCSWYTECLEKRHPCSANSDGYAVQYAQKFCSLYSERQYKFSDKGQRWINAVRKCLQVKLVPILRPYVHTNCKEIKEFAFDTHTPCYLAPYPGEPSICDLDPLDWGRVFWTIKGGFVSATIPSLKGMYEVSVGCGKEMLDSIVSPMKDAADTGMRLFKLIIETVKTLRCSGSHCITKRSVSTEYDDMANSIAEQLARQLQWKKDGIQWFAFVQNGSTANEIDVNILLGSRAMYDVNAVGVPDAILNKTVDDLTHAIGNEQLSIDIGQDFKVKNYSACLDLVCQETYNEVIPKLKTAVSDASFIAPKMPRIVLSLIFWILLFKM